jgi:hypothetical protein
MPFEKPSSDDVQLAIQKAGSPSHVDSFIVSNRTHALKRSVHGSFTVDQLRAIADDLERINAAMIRVMR